MFNKRKIGLSIATVVLFTGGVVIGSAAAQVRTPDNRKVSTVALADIEVKQLLTLMDTDKNGKISKAEFLKFMEAEFDRLDKDKSGELDVKELTQSQLRPAAQGK
jgi:hypothetical protein